MSLGNTGHKSETFTTANNLATNVAALTASSGISISHAQGYTAVLDVGSGHTITGGALRCYAYLPVTVNGDGTPATYDWVPYNAADVAAVTSTVANRYFPVGDQLPLTGIGRIVYLPDAVTQSAGTTLNIIYSTRRARQ